MASKNASTISTSPSISRSGRRLRAASYGRDCRSQFDGRRGSDAIRAAELPWSTVRVDEEAVEGVRPPTLLLGDMFRLVEPSVSGRARTATTAVMPSSERGRRLPPSIEAGGRVDEVDVVAVVASEVFAPEAQTRVACQHTGAVSEARGVERFPLVVGRVEHGARNLGVVGPRTPVEVVGPDLQPDVVDDTDLGVDVDGRAVRILQVVEPDAITARLAQPLDDAMPADVLGVRRDPSTALGEARYDRYQAQLRLTAKGVRHRFSPVLRPEVLVLDVDEPAGPPQRFAVGTSDAALTVGREWVGRAFGRVRADDLHRVWSGGSGVAPHRREWIRAARLAREVAEDDAHGVSVVEWRGILPPLSEGVRNVAN
jgi:hypothetical protein